MVVDMTGLLLSLKLEGARRQRVGLGAQVVRIYDNDSKLKGETWFGG